MEEIGEIQPSWGMQLFATHPGGRFGNGAIAWIPTQVTIRMSGRLAFGLVR